MRRGSLAGLLIFLSGFVGALADHKPEVSSLKPEAVAEFGSLSAKGQELFRYALSLTEKKLGYQYGSNTPANGGMDCSGTVSHILNHLGFQAPRMAHLIYLWAKDAGTLVAVKNCHALNDPQLARLRPGDLLFWEGTYDIGERDPPISHVMIYLGHEKSTGRAVMVGASSGRYYAGRARHGVSVFDFVMPSAKAESKFVAYARVPGLPPPGKANAPLPSASVDQPGPAPAPATPDGKPASPPPARAASSTPTARSKPAVRSPSPEKLQVREVLRRVFGQ